MRLTMRLKYIIGIIVHAKEALQEALRAMAEETGDISYGICVRTPYKMRGYEVHMRISGFLTKVTEYGYMVKTNSTSPQIV